MPLTREERERKIRPLTEVGLSTRKIAEITGIPQSTVVRDQQVINSGPQPILQPEQAAQADQVDQAKPAKRPRRRPSALALIAAALLVLAVAAGTFTWMRYLSSRQTVYAPVFQTQAPIYVCAGITLEGYLTDLAPATNGHCPKGWKLLILRSGS